MHPELQRHHTSQRTVTLRCNTNKRTLTSSKGASQLAAAAMLVILSAQCVRASGTREWTGLVDAH